MATVLHPAPRICSLILLTSSDDLVRVTKNRTGIRFGSFSSASSNVFLTSKRALPLRNLGLGFGLICNVKMYEL